MAKLTEVAVLIAVAVFCVWLVGLASNAKLTDMKAAHPVRWMVH